jgi:hypothetical protein
MKLSGKWNKKRWEKNAAEWEKEPRLIAGVLNPQLINKDVSQKLIFPHNLRELNETSLNKPPLSGMFFVA